MKLPMPVFRPYKLKISKNVAVKEACGSLDDQEGRGWLGADLLGVTLMHSYKPPTEAHTAGQQIDDILSEAKTHVERLKGAARKRKTDARKKGLGAEDLAAKLEGIDAKLARDLAEYARTAINIELPQGVVCGGEARASRPSATHTFANGGPSAHCRASGGRGSCHRRLRPCRCATKHGEGGGGRTEAA